MSHPGNEWMDGWMQKIDFFLAPDCWFSPPDSSREGFTVIFEFFVADLRSHFEFGKTLCSSHVHVRMGTDFILNLLTLALLLTEPLPLLLDEDDLQRRRRHLRRPPNSSSSSSLLDDDADDLSHDIHPRFLSPTSYSLYDSDLVPPHGCVMMAVFLLVPPFTLLVAS